LYINLRQAARGSIKNYE